MKQNIYDEPEFFAKYKHLRETASGLNDVLEQPALRALVSQMQGLEVLDLGSGMGHFALYCIQQGAKHVTGVDISGNMISYAKTYNNHEKIDYIQSPIEDLTLESRMFDLVISSFTLHYVQDNLRIVEKVHDWLKCEGLFIYSIEHPICTAQNPMLGWVSNEKGEKLYWPVDKYSLEGRRENRWFVEGVVKYHRKLSTLVNGLIFTGFEVEQLVEPEPLPDSISLNPGLINETRRPPVLIIRSRKTC